ncbi:acyltransferase family protein [Brucella sp. IR073]|uniref:acyltransferase family protein n=1 Tax=unclassified Brucella TaxID=2632610 RepID=UPI003B982D9E
MNRIDELEGLRGLLAVWVVAVHLLPAAGIEPHSFGIFAPLFGELIRVQIFCIMSGFVIFMMMAKLQESYPVYLARRVKRIYPVFILAFVLSILMSGIAYEALKAAEYGGARNALRLKLFEDSFAHWPYHVLAHATLTHGIIPEHWLPNGAYAFLGQAWNISTEFQFYVIAPLVFWCLHRPSLLLRGLLVAGLFTVWWLFRKWPNNADLAQYAVYFATGIVSYYAWKRDWSDRRFFNPATVILASALMCWLDFALAGWIFVFGSALIVRDQNRPTGYVASLLQHPIMLWLGAISYSLYLLHMIPLYFWMYVINGFHLGQASYALLLTTLTFATAIPMSFLCNKYVESVFYKSKTHRRPAAATALEAPVNIPR